MTNIFVARLDFGVTQDDLKTAFEQYGKVNKVSIAIDKETGKSKGFAFLEMENAEEAAAAIKSLDGFTINGRQIAVKEAENRESNRPRRDGAPGGDRKPFQRDNSDRPARPDFNRTPAIDPTVFNPSPDFIKSDRKKEAPKKKEKELKPKNHKMEAYKKSGKQTRYLDFDDDDDY